MAACKRSAIRWCWPPIPIFPAVATESRIRWAGLEPEDFAWYTTYENIGYSKPNPAYYQHILTRLGAQAEDCLMVGNDVDEDMGAAQQAGLSVFSPHRLPDQPGGKDITPLPSGGLRCPDGLCSVLGMSVQRLRKVIPNFSKIGDNFWFFFIQPPVVGGREGYLIALSSLIRVFQGIPRENCREQPGRYGKFFIICLTLSNILVKRSTFPHLPRKNPHEGPC